MRPCPCRHANVVVSDHNTSKRHGQLCCNRQHPRPLRDSAGKRHWGPTMFDVFVASSDRCSFRLVSMYTVASSFIMLRACGSSVDQHGH